MAILCIWVLYVLVFCSYARYYDQVVWFIATEVLKGLFSVKSILTCTWFVQFRPIWLDYLSGIERLIWPIMYTSFMWTRHVTEEDMSLGKIRHWARHVIEQDTSLSKTRHWTRHITEQHASSVLSCWAIDKIKVLLGVKVTNDYFFTGEQMFLVLFLSRLELLDMWDMRDLWVRTLDLLSLFLVIWVLDSTAAAYFHHEPDGLHSSWSFSAFLLDRFVTVFFY